MKIIYCLALSALVFTACNNSTDSKDPVEKADSANDAKMDTNSSSAPATIQTDESTTDFLVKAADGGMAEVSAGKVAQSKAVNAQVKNFADMMVMDHMDANGKVKALAGGRNVTLPDSSSDEHRKDLDKLKGKSGKDFDKAYMDQMVSDHKKTIDLFQKANDDSKDAEVKMFVSNTLPKLQMHLDSAQAIYKRLK